MKDWEEHSIFIVINNTRVGEKEIEKESVHTVGPCLYDIMNTARDPATRSESAKNGCECSVLFLSPGYSYICFEKF